MSLSAHIETILFLNFPKSNFNEWVDRAKFDIRPNKYNIEFKIELNRPTGIVDCRNLSNKDNCTLYTCRMFQLIDKNKNRSLQTAFMNASQPINLSTIERDNDIKIIWNDNNGNSHSTVLSIEDEKVDCKISRGCLPRIRHWEIIQPIGIRTIVNNNSD